MGNQLAQMKMWQQNVRGHYKKSNTYKESL